MNENTDNGPIGLRHETTKVGLLLRREQLNQAAKSEIDRFWDDAIKRINAVRLTPAVRTRTREQITEAQKNLEVNRTYWRLLDGKLEPISK
jgi:hypothetical protein